MKKKAGKEQKKRNKILHFIYIIVAICVFTVNS